MSEFQESSAPSSGTARWVGLAVIVLAAISLVSLGMGWSAISNARNAEQAAQKQNEALLQRLAKAEEANQQLQSDIHVVAEKLNVTQSDLAGARKQNKSLSANYDKKLTGLETSMKTELSTKASNEDLNKLNGDVQGVKGDLEGTKGSIQMARSELGTLIARNHDEIDQLRRLGQREYFEFTVTRKQGPQRVGEVQIELKDTNTKKNRYTINVLADDRSFEKKDRSVNEPIFFYTGGSRTALELVINKVTKTAATGYLSIPKAAAASASGSSGK